MSDPVIVGLLSGAGAVGLREIITWIRNHGKDKAETGLTIDQRWEKYAEALEGRLGALETRVTDLEDELETERKHSKGLEAEVEKYRSIARSLLRHVLKLRDTLAKAHVEMPEIPPDIEDALTGVDLP